mmetsp:Transcript_6129/g.6749  ORF Transcript_6129/g.6749 Transcript_6129/m.6749 type:complete len:99 (-) Transcript_6129:257-553(-)
MVAMWNLPIALLTFNSSTYQNLFCFGIKLRYPEATTSSRLWTIVWKQQSSGCRTWNGLTKIQIELTPTSLFEMLSLRLKGSSTWCSKKDINLNFSSLL